MFNYKNVVSILNRHTYSFHRQHCNAYLRTRGEEGVGRGVEHIYVHGNYNDNTSAFNIALLKLTKPFNLSTTTAVSLASRDSPVEDCFVTGRTNITSSSRDTMQFVRSAVTIISRDECERQTGHVILPSEICAQQTNATVIYSKDKGGLLICENNGSDRLVGVLSPILQYDNSTVPIIFSWLPYYIPWIESVKAWSDEGGPVG
ncbi:hypothetical protein ScPMuIL_003093 [Solemya velum]